MAYRLRGRYGYSKDEPFRPTFHPDKLLRPLTFKKSKKIFVDSMGDFFDPGVLDVWRGLVLEVMKWSLRHQFLVLTKQVVEMDNFFSGQHQYPPNNLWLGISQDGKTTNDDDIEFFRGLNYISNKFVSFEPLLGPITSNFYGIDWIIIGAQSLPGGKTKQPKKAWVADIIREADSWNIPVFLKNNLDWSVPRLKRQEFPEVTT